MCSAASKRSTSLAGNAGVPGATAPLPRNYIDTYVAPPWREAMRAKFLECIRHGIDWNIVMQVVRAEPSATSAVARRAASTCASPRAAASLTLCQALIASVRLAAQGCRAAQDLGAALHWLLTWVCRVPSAA